MARKKKHEEHENHERWLVSYADFITLLFAFFVVMYSISSVNEGKYRVLSDALLAAFRSPPKSLLPIQEGQATRSPQTDNLGHRPTTLVVAAPDLPMPDVARKKQGTGDSQGGGTNPMAEIADRLEAELQRLIDEDLIAVRYTDNYVEVEIKSEILFPAASAQLTQQARTVLAKLAKVLRNFPNVVRVEGYTDDSPMKSVVYPSNWELSAARAGAVVRLFQQDGLQPARMAAVGYGEYRPIADNATPEGRIKNRRVSVVVVNETATAQLREDLQFAANAKDGKPPRHLAEEDKGWRPPVDVTRSPLTDSGRFEVMESPIQLGRPVVVEVAPPAAPAERPKQ